MCLFIFSFESFLLPCKQHLIANNTRQNRASKTRQNLQAKPCKQDPTKPARPNTTNLGKWFLKCKFHAIKPDIDNKKFVLWTMRFVCADLAKHVKFAQFSSKNGPPPPAKKWNHIIFFEFALVDVLGMIALSEVFCFGWPCHAICFGAKFLWTERAVGVYVYIHKDTQGVVLRMNPTCDEEGSYFENLIISAVL